MTEPSDSGTARGPRGPRPGARVPWALAVLSLVLAAGGEAVRAFARFDRAGIETGQLWRLVTGHWVHLGWGHTLLNVAALGAVAVLFTDVMSRRDWLLGTLLAMAAIDAGLYWLEPGVAWYVGMSGVLHGLVLVGATRLAAVQPGLGGAVLAGLAAKLVWEAVGGPSPWTEAVAGGPVIVGAHLYGAAGAGAYLAAAHVRRVSRVSL